MPRYYFDVDDGARDPDGVDLADLDEARATAVRFASDALRDAGANFWNRADWRLNVRDADGAALFSLQVTARDSVG